MAPAHSAVFVDLDRTLLRSASGPILQEALMAEGVLTSGRGVPGDLLYAFYERFGETVPFIALARAAARVMRGKSAEGTRRAGKVATAQLIDLVQPFALEALAEHRRAGRRLVLATTTPIDLIDALAVALGFDAVVATKYEIVDGLYTGRLDGGFVW
ncbi:MAG TPA: HAD family hydrolase, partial [Acidimicrobiales bacterium]|nr:HAD family hydrolase [Acidimicrobiales bacterium]